LFSLGLVLVAALGAWVALSAAGRAAQTEVGPAPSRPAASAASVPHAIAPAPPDLTPTPSCTLGWRVVPYPTPSSAVESVLRGTTALAPDDVWAVGHYDDVQGAAHLLIDHWDGQSWNAAPTPDLTGRDPIPAAAVAISTNDVWAVGDTSTDYHTLALHWDGSVWSVVPSPNAGNADMLLGLAALASNDVWAVGYYSDDTSLYLKTLIEHWDGSQWLVVPSPNPGPGNNELEAVTALGPNDIWAVGSYADGNNGNDVTLTLRWDGTTWSVVPSPNAPGATQDVLHGVTGIAPNDVWAVGFANSGISLIEHWDGSTWTIVPAATAGVLNYIFATAARASNDIWAVGQYFDSGGYGYGLVLHWDGTAWTVSPSPNPGDGAQLFGVAPISDKDVWTVGDYMIGFQYNALSEHYSNPCVTPSPTPTGTPPTAAPTTTRTPTVTGTPTSRTPTRTASPTLSPTLTPTVTPTSTIPPTLTPGGCDVTNYVITASASATIVPGDVDIGNHCNDCTTTIALPFPFTFYGQNFSAANVSSNGNLQFVSNDPSPTDVCLPGAPFSYAIMPDWTDLDTSLPGIPPGYIHTSVSGTAPNRIFNIEWHAAIRPAGSLYDDFEVRLYENAPDGRFDIIYGDIPRHGHYATVGIQRDGTTAVQYECNTYGSVNRGLQLTFTLPPCASPSPTPTGTPPTPTPTTTRTPTVTGTPPTSTPTLTAGPALSPTATSTPPASTATATTTPCTLSFSDVHQNDYFYTPVLYLACRGVVSGYSDGTFRPYINTTRSQMTKIVVLGFNKAIVTPTGTAYSFTDVTRSNPFFSVVETAYANGIVSGYTCGVAPAGPCDAQHRPWFLPYAYVTRGQLSKIDVLAANWTQYNPPVGHFADVPRGSVFYTVIETAYCHGVISGYNDGTFRPYNNAIRGQIAKIVYLSIVNPPMTCGP